MAAKKPTPDPKKLLSTTMDVEPSWLERDSSPPLVSAPPSSRRSRRRPPPMPSLPGIEVKDEWLEPSSRRGKRKLPPPLPTMTNAPIVKGSTPIAREEAVTDPPPPSKRPRKA